MFKKWKEKRATKKQAIQEQVNIVAKTEKVSLASSILDFAANAGEEGIVVVEVREQIENHHGYASGALSNLHKSGQLARLSDKRKGCKIYVLPKFVNGRETEKQGRN